MIKASCKLKIFFIIFFLFLLPCLLVSITNKPVMAHAEGAIEVSIVNINVPDHVYDRNTDIELKGGELQGIQEGDDVSFLLNTGVAEQNSVGNSIPVITNIELIGVDASKYVLIQPSLLVNIVPKEIIIKDVVANERVYDGTTSVLLSGGTLEGVLPNDDVSFVLNSGELANKSIGENKPVVTNIVLSGEDCLNYVLQQPKNVVANILPKDVTISNLEAVDREYDGTSNVELAGGTLEGVIQGDNVFFICGQATVNDKAVGEDKIVSINVQLNGADSNNYALQGLEEIRVSITPKSLTVTGISTTNRDYDGTTSVAISGGTLQGVITGDNVAFNLGQGIIQDKNVGSQKVVITNITIFGEDSSNYSIVQPDLYVDITAKKISIINVFASNRESNGKKIVDLMGGTLIGVIGGDSVNFNLGVGTIANAGKGKYNVATDISLTGEDSINYILEQPNNISVELFAKDTSNISTFFIVSTLILLSLLIAVILFYFLKLKKPSPVLSVNSKEEDVCEPQAKTPNLANEISKLKQSTIILKKQRDDAIDEKNRIEKELHEELQLLMDKKTSLQLQLQDKNNIVDVFPVIKDALLPFIENILYKIHEAEDDGLMDNSFVASISAILKKFLIQTLSIKEIDVVFSEYDNKGMPFKEQDAEVVPKYTAERSKDGLLFRTLRPGIIMKGAYVSHEKVEVWCYRE